VVAVMLWWMISIRLQASFVADGAGAGALSGDAGVYR
jgi:hypothetical protein